MKHFSEFVSDDNTKRTKAYDSMCQHYANMNLEWFYDEFEVGEFEKCIFASNKQDCIEGGAVVSVIHYDVKEKAPI